MTENKNIVMRRGAVYIPRILRTVKYIIEN